jgi:hypothetical protein
MRTFGLRIWPRVCGDVNKELLARGYNPAADRFHAEASRGLFARHIAVGIFSIFRQARYQEKEVPAPWIVGQGEVFDITTPQAVQACEPIKHLAGCQIVDSDGNIPLGTVMGTDTRDGSFDI